MDHHNQQQLPVRPPPLSKQTEEEVRRLGGFTSLPEFGSRQIMHMRTLFPRVTHIAAEHLATLADRYKDKSINLYFGILASEKFEAKALAGTDANGDECDLIMFSAGLIMNFHYLFHRVMSCPLNFPDVGNAACEDFYRALVDDVPRNVIADNVDYCGPICPVRRIYADGLFDFCIIFLIYHEFAHHFNGHLNYQKEVGRLNLLPAQKQALEIDADCLAAAFTQIAINQNKEFHCRISLSAWH